MEEEGQTHRRGRDEEGQTHRRGREEEGRTHRRGRDYVDLPPAPLLDKSEFKIWSFYRDLISEFIATLLFLYIAVCTVVAQKNQTGPSDGVGRLLVAWAFGGMTFILVYCTAGVSGGYINPAVTFGLFLARRMSLNRAVAFMMAQCLGSICGVGLVKASMKPHYNSLGGGANLVAPGYSTGAALGAEILGTFVLVFTVLSATDPKRRARDSHVPGLAPLPIGFAVFIVHLATIPITGTGINPARSFGAAVIYNHRKVWADQWLFWFGPFVGALAATSYHQHILRSAAVKAVVSFRNNPANTSLLVGTGSDGSHPRTRREPPGNFDSDPRSPRSNFDPRSPHSNSDPSSNLNPDPRGNPPGNDRPCSNPRRNPPGNRHSNPPSIPQQLQPPQQLQLPRRSSQQPQQPPQQLQLPQQSSQQPQQPQQRT